MIIHHFSFVTQRSAESCRFSRINGDVADGDFVVLGGTREGNLILALAVADLEGKNGGTAQQDDCE